jgi:5'-phosphate synthase pdxT subunit
MIMLAERASGQKQGGQPLLGGLDVTVNRNHFGRQLQSFETRLDVPALGDEPVHAVFIRAPGIVDVGKGVEILAHFGGEDAPPVIVAVRQGPILATAFHPELTDDLRWHRLFVEIVAQTASDEIPTAPLRQHR